MRISHYIKGNKTSSIPADFVFFDCETSPKKTRSGDIDQPFKLGVGLYWRRRTDGSPDTLEYIEFTNAAKFWAFIDSKALPKRRLVVVAHNLQFDYMVLGGFGYMRKLGYDLTKLITNGKTNIFAYRRDKTSVIFLDNMNYFNTSIRTLGKSVALKKLPMPKKKSTLKDWFTYCQRDVDIMYQAWRYWLTFIKDQDLGTFGLTLASQSFNAYRHRFMPYKILVTVNSVATELERSSYRGGRVECFELGELPKQDYFLLDINSMYPYCMKTNRYPTRLRYLRHNPDISFLERVLKDRCVTADVLLTVTEPIFSLKYKGRLITPAGTFRATLNTPELCKAVELNAIKQVFTLAVYDCEPIFSDFVDYFYSARMNFEADGKGVFAYLCKIMLNSLYGKFGQRNEEWQFIGTEPEPVDYVETEIDAQTGKRTVIRCIAGQISKTVSSVEGYNSFAAISAEVSANARMLLAEYIKKAGKGNYFYCDTDSLIVNRRGLEGLSDMIDPNELGKLKLVKSATEITLHNVKDYVISGKRKIKGIPRKARKNAAGEYVTYQQVGVRSGLRAGNIDSIKWKRVPKVLERVYNKGIVIADSRVEPLIMTCAFDTNWLDYEGMIEQYGNNARYQGKYLRDIMYPTKYEPDFAEAGLEDYRPEERRQILIDDQEARRAGEMIYQRR